MKTINTSFFNMPGMIKRSALFAGVVAALTLSISQVHAQSVTYKVTKNDAFDIKNFTFAIDPFFVDLNGHNGSAFGWGIRANYLMGKTLDWSLDYRNGFGTNGYKISNDNTRNYSWFEGGVGLTLSHKVKTRNLPIILSSSSYSSGGYTYTKTVSIAGGVPGQIRAMTSFRVGLIQYGNAFKYANYSDSLMTIKNKTTNAEFTLKDSAQYVVKDSFFDFGGINSMILYAGFNFKNIHQLILDVDGYGVRGNQAYRDFFVDFMFAPVNSIKNVKRYGVEYDVKYGKNRVIGWRMGWSLRKPKDQGFSFKFEFGQRPGPKAVTEKLRNWYCMVTYGLYIPLKIKPIATEE